MTTEQSESGAPRKRTLPAKSLAAALVIAAILAIAYREMSHSAREVMGGFGEGTARSPRYTEYYGEANRALEAWLKSHGFQETPVLNPRGEARTNSVYERWFVGTHQGSYRFIVELNLGSANKAGLGAETVWEWRGLKWGMNQDRERARDFSRLVRQWWDDYSRDHPHP